MIQVRNLSYTYPGGAFRLTLDRLDLNQGEMLCITGPSGSGKTTLIHLLSGILLPDAGSVRVAGLPIVRGNDRSLRAFRLSRIGFIFQDFELLEYLTVEQNILLPYLLDRNLARTRPLENRLEELLRETGLEQRRHARPGKLSHGEKQRTAVCRALITRPDLVIGDEPTANLDRANAERIMEQILGLVREQGTTFILVTHDEALAAPFDRKLDLGQASPEKGDRHL